MGFKEKKHEILESQKEWQKKKSHAGPSVTGVQQSTSGKDWQEVFREMCYESGDLH